MKKQGYINSFLLLSVIFSVGCAVFSDRIINLRKVSFSHKAHLEVLEGDCEKCHPGDLKTENPKMPDIETCNECHTDEKKYLKLVQSRIANGEIKWSSYTKLGEETIFFHPNHVSNEVSCNTCHEKVVKGKRVKASAKFEMDSCLECHVNSEKELDCALCHKVIRKDKTPPSHENNWERLHGKQSGYEMLRSSDNRCSLCHQDSSCDTCHMTQMPLDHTNIWRDKTHGITSTLNIERCYTCHQSSFCVDCHQNEAPQNHKGAWASPVNTHCNHCHYPVADTRCGFCHQSSHSHIDLGQPVPRNKTHFTATKPECWNCHVPFMTPHPQTGIYNCRDCHRI
jgi:Cytochrome c7 and related cytochrome c